MEHERQPSYLIKFARENRSNLTLPEKLLWKRLKASANTGFKFNRQYPILGRYIVDFFYEDLQLAIEVDGLAVHSQQVEEDETRQRAIEATGVVFLRIPANFILREPDDAADFVLSVCRGEVSLDDLDDCYL